MKRALLPLLALLVLAGCGGGEAELPSQPTAAVVTQTPAPTTDPNREWWEGVSTDALPLEAGGQYEDGEVMYRVLGTVPKDELALYLVTRAGVDEARKLLRYGDVLQGVGGWPGPVSDALACTAFLWTDPDGDGAKELVTAEVGMTAAMVVYEWDDGWTVRPYDGYGDELKSLLNFQQDGQTASVSYGGNTATYAMGPNDTAMGERSPFSQYVFFNVDPASGQTSAVFAVSVEVDGEARAFASVTAQVEYDGARFALRNLNLLSVGGV